VARLARAAYAHLDLISYFTVGSDEVRAWTIHRGTRPAKQPERFTPILSEAYSGRGGVLRGHGARETVAKLREKGLLRLEGKDYVVQDGDIISFRFNV